jgi:hypothetical protein
MRSGPIHYARQGGIAMTPLLVAVGGVLGFSLGLLGAGGSILAVPALVMLGGLPPRQAMASGLLTDWCSRRGRSPKPSLDPIDAGACSPSTVQALLAAIWR